MTLVLRYMIFSSCISSWFCRAIRQFHLTQDRGFACRYDERVISISASGNSVLPCVSSLFLLLVQFVSAYFQRVHVHEWHAGQRGKQWGRLCGMKWEGIDENPWRWNSLCGLLHEKFVYNRTFWVEIFFDCAIINDVKFKARTMWGWQRKVRPVKVRLSTAWGSGQSYCRMPKSSKMVKWKERPSRC